MKIETIDISLIKSNPKNPRIINDDKFKKLVQSIKDFPEMLNIRPIVVNKKMMILGGNMRLRACIEAGIKKVPIIKADKLTLNQEREFIIKDNVSGGEWDWDILANEWNAEQLEEWGLDIPNFKDDHEKDLSDKINTSFRIELTLEDEEQQEKLYNEMLERGIDCRILTL